MSRNSRLFLCSIVLGLIVALMPISGFASDQSAQTSALTARIQRYNDAHEAAADSADGEIAIEAEDDFDAQLFLMIQKDILFSMERMVGVLDRYSGSGFPEHCDEFVSYYLIVDSLMFEFLFLDIPAEWVDIAIISLEAGTDALDKIDTVVQLCTNGGRGSLTEHNRSFARIALVQSMEKLRTGIRATEERGSVSADSLLEEIVNDPSSGADIDNLWRQGGDVAFNSTDLYLDMLLSETILEHLGGLYDRLLAGGSAECEDLLFLLDLLSEPIIFNSVPAEWVDVYNGHLNSVLTALDTSAPMGNLCASGSNVAPDAAQVQSGRYGVNQALNQLRGWINALEERIGANERL